MKLAQKNGIPAHSQERDYVQVLFLNSLYPEQNIVFKGDTALRLAYGSNRYSEDLDFNSYTEATPSMLKKAAKNLKMFGIDYELKDEREKSDSYSFRIVYKGPLYVGQDRSQDSIRIEASLREEEIDKETKLVSSPYPEVDDFLITVMDLRHIFAEKVRALVVRTKPRDLYDIWILIQKKVDLERSLLNKKLSVYNKEFEIDQFKKKVEEVRNDWEQDLNVLLPSVPPFEQVSDQVISEFEVL